MEFGIGIALIVIYTFVVVTARFLEKKAQWAMFDGCATVDEVAKKGPIEQPELDERLARMGKRGDVEVAKRLAVERMEARAYEATTAKPIRLVD